MKDKAKWFIAGVVSVVLVMVLIGATNQDSEVGRYQLVVQDNHKIFVMDTKKAHIYSYSKIDDESEFTWLIVSPQLTSSETFQTLQKND